MAARFGSCATDLVRFYPPAVAYLPHYLELSGALPFTLLLGLTPIPCGKSYCNNSRRDDDNNMPQCHGHLGLVFQGYL